MRLGILSEKYEGGGCGTISTGEGDSGGISYGTYQLASATGSVTEFVDWLLDRADFGAGYGALLDRFEPGTLEFSTQWTWLADTDPDGFAKLQDEYIAPRYFGAACEEAQGRGVDTETMPDALKCVLFSNAVQHGAYYAGELLAESFCDDPTEWICRIYDTKITDPSWSSGAPSLRPGLFARWESEKQDALILLAGGDIT